MSCTWYGLPVDSSQYSEVAPPWVRVKGSMTSGEYSQPSIGTSSGAKRRGC